MKRIIKKTYSQQIVEYVTESIKFGKYRLGEQITELDIAKRYQISQAPVREAFKILILNGLIEQKGKNRKYITRLTPKEIDDSYFTGGVIEGAIVASVANSFNEKDILTLEEIVKKMKKAANENLNIDALAKLDLEFHNYLLSRGKNEIARNLWFRSCQLIGKVFYFTEWKQMFEPSKVHMRHNELLQAIKKKDKNLIEKKIRYHYNSAGKIISKYASIKKQ